MSCYSTKEELLAYVQFVEEIFTSTKLIERPKDVADVDIDATLQFRIELKIATKRFNVAIESQPHEFTVSIHHGRARIATRNVVVGDEACGQLAIFTSIATEVARLIELAHTWIDDVIRVGTIFFFKHAFQCGAPIVVYPIARIH